MSGDGPLVINGWNIFAHPLFIEQVEQLLTQVENLRQKDPVGYREKNATKCLAAIAKLAFDVIPQDPTRNEYRLGSTLRDEYKYWFRAKIFQQSRLFFRYHQDSKILVFVWVNDENSKRGYHSKTDVYRVFQKMLNSGYPLDEWDDLMTEIQGESERLKQIANYG